MSVVRQFVRMTSNEKFITNSSSSGMRERKSRTSLLVTTCGRIIRLVNLMMPQASKSTRIGMK